MGGSPSPNLPFMHSFMHSHVIFNVIRIYFPPKCMTIVKTFLMIQLGLDVVFTLHTLTLGFYTFIE